MMGRPPNIPIDGIHTRVIKGHACALTPCKKCGKERWVQVVYGKPKSQFCRHCVSKVVGLKGKYHRWWKGGRCVDSRGYISHWVSPESKFHAMCDKNNRVKEHRLVMAQSLNRVLKPWEIVHHKNGDKTDNQLQNLELLEVGSHSVITILQERISFFEKEVAKLREVYHVSTHNNL